MAQVVTQQQLQLLPEYQETFLKDLLANVYRTEVDPETGQRYAAGIGAVSPLYGQPQFDAQGNPIYKRDSSGNLVLDARGQPIQEVIGGVPAPDVMPLTPLQQQAIQMGAQGIGAYAPMMEEAKQTYGAGVSALQTGFDPVTGQALAYDPTSYEAYYDPFVEQVIDITQRDIQRAGDIEKQGIRARAATQGAFGGSRAAVAEREQQRGIEDQMARTGAQLRSQAYTGAQQQAQSAFQNQMQRGQTGAQVFQGLGTAQAGLGQLAQGLAQEDVQNLMYLGGIEQQQRQSEYDVQRQAAIEQAYEPFQRFSYMSDIFRGVPSTSSALTTGTAPEQNTIGSVVGTAMGLGAYQQQYGNILGGT